MHGKFAAVMMYLDAVVLRENPGTADVFNRVPTGTLVLQNIHSRNDRLFTKLQGRDGEWVTGPVEALGFILFWHVWGVFCCGRNGK